MCKDLMYSGLCYRLMSSKIGNSRQLLVKACSVWHDRHVCLSDQVTNTYLLMYLFTPWSAVLPEKLTVCQPVKKFPAFYGTRRFITTSKSARHLSLSWASSIQSMPPSQLDNQYYITELPSHKTFCQFDVNKREDFASTEMYSIIQKISGLRYTEL